MATYPIRPVADDELVGFLAVDQHASHGTPMSERARANLLARLEFDRTLAAFGGDTIVGAAGAFSFQMRVPGAMAAVAGVSLVAVLPSHRRQGILSALMRRQLADVSGRGEAVAALFCSESGIYGRYGYGRASWQAAYRLLRGEGALAPGAPADPGLRLRIAEPFRPAPSWPRSTTWPWPSGPACTPAPSRGGTACSPTCIPTAKHHSQYGACWPRTTRGRAVTRCSPPPAGGTRTRSCRRVFST